VVRQTAATLRLDRQAGQPRRLAVWCEAAGMVPQLSRVPRHRRISEAFSARSETTNPLVPRFGTCHIASVLIVGFDIIAALIDREKRSRPPRGKTLDRRVAAWKQEVELARWQKPTEVKAIYGAADVIGDNRIVFDICGNNYRLVVQFNYPAGVARIRFAGTHAEYNKIDVRTI
jgi:mRNA interferase HigB